MLLMMWNGVVLAILWYCLAKTEGQVKTEARRLRKEDQKVDGVLKETILNHKNEDDSEGHDETEGNVFEKPE